MDGWMDGWMGGPAGPWTISNVEKHTGCLKKKGDVFIGPQIHRFTHPVFSPLCTVRLGQGSVSPSKCPLA